MIWTMDIGFLLFFLYLLVLKLLLVSQAVIVRLRTGSGSISAQIVHKDIHVLLKPLHLQLAGAMIIKLQTRRRSFLAAKVHSLRPLLQYALSTGLVITLL